MDNSSPKIYTEFLPISRADMEARGWEQLDFVVVGGDAYVDHPSFGTAIISRLLEAEGYKIGVLAQPRYTDCEDFKRFGKPKYGFFIGGGNVDSMVSHYSVAKIPRAEDEYSPGGKGGARPDRSATVYTRLAKQAYPDLPVILGGLEASLRRFAHYDYWLDTVLPSIAEDSGADIISFGMGEHQTVEIARRLAAGEPVETITDVDGTCYMTDFDHLPERYVECAGFKKVASDKTAYAKACRIQMDNQDVVSGQIIVQKQSEKYLVQNIPAKPLVRGELDKVYALPYTRRYHPIYESMGGVPAIREVQFSIIQNRGCFGGCNFCAIQLHQGRRVTSRSADSIVAEAERMTHEPDFKGYIHDVGGPTANFRFPSCREQMLRGMCTGGKHCLAPTTCSHMIVDHSDYLKILRRVRELPGVKKVFIRSGIRFDYLMADPDDTFFKELVEYHVSGQLKVAPEHCAPNTLAYMGKPPIETFNKFKDKFYELSKKAGKKQYLVPYLMSSHPGSTLKDAVYLAEYLYKNHMRPEQVQDFYPTPGTVSTCMFYTGLDPYTLKPVFVEKTPEGKALQRALLQYYEPRNAEKVVKALKMTHREDLIPLLVPAAGRRAMQRSARRAEAADVTIHNDGTYTVRPNQKSHNGKPARGQSRGAAPAGRAPSPGARFAPHSAPAGKFVRKAGSKFRQQAHVPQSLPYPLLPLGGGEVGPDVLQALAHDIAHLGALVQRGLRVLKDHLDLLDDLPVQLAGNFAVDLLAFIEDVTARGGQDAQDGPADGGLAAAALAHKAEGLALINFKAGVLHGMIGVAAGAVGHIQVVYFHKNFAFIFHLTAPPLAAFSPQQAARLWVPGGPATMSWPCGWGIR